MSRLLRNERPLKRKPKAMTLEERKRDSQCGAQYSATLEQWMGFMWDGLHLSVFDFRMTRERALSDARKHHDRVFRPERAARRWTGQAQA